MKTAHNIDLAAGDIITIYEDPFTEEKPEGQAKIIKVSKIEGHHWGRPIVALYVVFLGEEKAGAFPRTYVMPEGAE